MNTNTQQQTDCSVFGYYKGHIIEGWRTGHPQIQNVEIDGKPVGYVVFPTSVIATGRSIIDARQEIGA